jgi:formylglycine-generating enzyme required for sulfatase activity
LQARHNQAQADWIATRAPGMGAGGFPPAGLRQTPAAAFYATATLQAAPWIPTEQVFNTVPMVLVPAGCFWMGSLASAAEQPVHEICFAAPFWIDRYEVTNAQFAQFGGMADRASSFCDPNEDGIITTDQQSACANLPREQINWFEARAFCELRGGRLPTEAEWEYAARGPNSLQYPWGNEFVRDNLVYANNSNNQPAAVGSRDSGNSWVGAADMSGNVQEWTSSLYLSYPYIGSDGREVNAGNRTDVSPVLHGGSWNIGHESFLRAASRSWNFSRGWSESIGFRCALS